MILLRLYINFFLAGLFSIGGGLATLPFLHDIGERTGWFTAHELADMLAVSESTPGAIGINMATYAGFRTAGIPGALITTLALITPGVIIILIVARILQRFQDSRYVTYVFNGLKPASVALITAAGLSVMQIAIIHYNLIGTGSALEELVDIKALILAGVLFVLIHKFRKIHPVVFIGFSALAGIVFSFAQ